VAPEVCMAGMPMSLLDPFVLVIVVRSINLPTILLHWFAFSSCAKSLRLRRQHSFRFPLDFEDIPVGRGQRPGQVRLPRRPEGTGRAHADHVADSYLD
jgi:hypothetical protein